MLTAAVYAVGNIRVRPKKASFVSRHFIHKPAKGHKMPPNRQTEAYPTARYHLVETDMFGRDDPDEGFLCIERKNGKSRPIFFSERQAKALQEVLNGKSPGKIRWWKVVPEGYELIGGFEP